MLNAAIYIVFAILLIVCALLLLLVLMQRPKQEGLGAAFGAQMTDQAFGAQTTDVLKKGTVIFGTLFMVLCFVLTLLMTARAKQNRSQIGQELPTAVPAEVVQPAAPANLEEMAAQELPGDSTPAAPAQAEAVDSQQKEAPVESAPAVEQPAS